MSYFKAEMHQNSISAGALPGPRWGSFLHSPDPELDLRGIHLRGRKGGSVVESINP